MVSISAITSGVSKAFGYGKRVLKVAPELAFGTASEKMGSAMKATNGSVFKKAQAGWQALEKAGSGSFFSKLFKNLINLPKAFTDSAKAGARLAGTKGTNKFLGGLKGVLSKFGKKMPFIMSAAWIIMEIPNVWTATKEQGIFQGAKEVLKFGARMTTAGLGSAIGAASPIPGGSLIGWMAGEWLASRIVGKSYKEQKAEKEEMIKELTGQDPNAQEQIQQLQVLPQIQVQQPANPNPYWLNNQQAAQTTPNFKGNMSNPFDYNQYKLQSMPYADDIMMKNMPFNVVA